MMLIELLGSAFPATQKTVAKAYESAIYTYRSTEQFIERLFPVDIRYSLRLDCRVTQDGWRDFLLSAFLRDNGILRHNKSLDFYIAATYCPKPFSIYWKVRNVDNIAEQLDCIRGQIHKTDSSHQKERTDFQGAHYIEFYLIKNSVCVARDKIDVPIGTV